MAFLYKHLQIHQIFGANTGVGKTIFATALVRASAVRLNRTRDQGGTTIEDTSRVYYLKPVSTGPLNEADDGHIAHFAGPNRSRIGVACLYQLSDPVSPHLAVKLAREKQQETDGTPLPGQYEYSQEEFIKRTTSHISGIANETGPFSSLFIEAAGGVLSPSLAGMPQIDAYRPLFLPTLLVGDSRLGGISSTISAYESLVLRGYVIDAILLFRDDYYRNWEYLEEYFGGLKGREKLDIVSVPPPPPRMEDPERDAKSLERYYADLVKETEISGAQSRLSDFLDSLNSKHSARLAKLESMPQRALDSIWWPFVQHKGLQTEQVAVIDSAYGDLLNTATVHCTPAPALAKNPKEVRQSRVTSLIQQQYDASASWWTQSVGHAHHSLTLAATRAAGRYGHVIFPLAIHEPALQLAERLIGEGGPGAGWADKVFFSDNGSTGTEVALKMAIRAAALRYDMRLSAENQEMHILGISGSYHGDTIGAMDACEDGVFNSSVEWYRGRGYWFKPPRVGIKKGKLIITLPSDLRSETPLTETMKTPSGNHEIRVVREPPVLSYIRFEGPVTSALEWVYDVQSRLDSPIARIYLESIRRQLTLLRLERRTFGALVIEPLVMGAGGMVFVDPLFQRLLIMVVRSECPLPIFNNNNEGESDISSKEWRGLPVIFDEVFVGLYRLGFLRASDILGVEPDISVLAKMLTGGLLPLSVTLARQSIYDAFLGDRKEEAMLHGHSYTAHPIGCAVGKTSFDLSEDIVTNSEEWKGAKTKWAPLWTGDSGSQNKIVGTAEPRVWSLWDPEFVSTLSQRSHIQEVMTLGTILVLRISERGGSDEIFASRYQASSADSFMREVKRTLEDSPSSQFGIHFRALGNVAYLMCSLNTPSQTLRTLEHAMLSILP